jgi:hypothetical protein
MAGNMFDEGESHFGSLTPEKCLARRKPKMKEKNQHLKVRSLIFFSLTRG